MFTSVHAASTQGNFLHRTMLLFTHGLKHVEGPDEQHISLALNGRMRHCRVCNQHQATRGGGLREGRAVRTTALVPATTHSWPIFLHTHPLDATAERNAFRTTLSRRHLSNATEPLSREDKAPIFGNQSTVHRGAQQYLAEHAWDPPCRQCRASVPPALLPRHSEPQQGLGEVVRDPLAHKAGKQADAAAVHQRPDVVAVERGHNLVRGCVEAEVFPRGGKQREREMGRVGKKEEEKGGAFLGTAACRGARPIVAGQKKSIFESRIGICNGVEHSTRQVFRDQPMRGGMHTVNSGTYNRFRSCTRSQTRTTWPRRHRSKPPDGADH